MKKYFLILIILTIFNNFSWASEYKQEIPCVNGYCQGWQIIQERKGLDENAIYYFYNNSGTAAFKLRIVINCFDGNGNPIGQIPQLVQGAIQQTGYVQLPVRLRKGTFKTTVEIYYIDTYEQSGIIGDQD